MRKGVLTSGMAEWWGCVIRQWFFCRLWVNLREKVLKWNIVHPWTQGETIKLCNEGHFCKHSDILLFIYIATYCRRCSQIVHGKLHCLTSGMAEWWGYVIRQWSFFCLWVNPREKVLKWNNIHPWTHEEKPSSCAMKDTFVSIAIFHYLSTLLLIVVQLFVYFLCFLFVAGVHRQFMVNCRFTMNFLFKMVWPSGEDASDNDPFVVC